MSPDHEISLNIEQEKEEKKQSPTRKVLLLISILFNFAFLFFMAIAAMIPNAVRAIFFLDLLLMIFTLCVDILLKDKKMTITDLFVITVLLISIIFI